MGLGHMKGHQILDQKYSVTSGVTPYNTARLTHNVDHKSVFPTESTHTYKNIYKNNSQSTLCIQTYLVLFDKKQRY